MTNKVLATIMAGILGFNLVIIGLSWWSLAKSRQDFLAEWHAEIANTCIFLGLFAFTSIIAGWVAFLGWKRNIAAKASLRANDERMRLFFERQIVGMAISNPDKTWNMVNDKWCRIFGYDWDELKKMTWEELSYPDDLHENIEKFDQLVAGTIDDYSLTKRFVRKDGSIIVAELSVGCVRNEDGTLNCLLTLMVDVTERKRFEDSLRESEAREKERANELDAIMASVPALILIAQDTDGRLITGNRSACELLRIPMGGNFSKRAADDSGPNHYVILHDGVEMPPRELPLHRALRGEYIQEYQQEILFGDGTRVTLLGNAIPLKDGQGSVRGAVAAFLDVTTHIRTSEALRESEERYRVLFEQSPDGIVLVDPNTFELHHFNDAACRDLGYTREEFARLTIQDLDPLEELPMIQERARSLIETGTAAFETIHVTKQGEPRNVEVHLQYVTISGRSLISSIYHDITGRKRSEAALKASEEKFRTFVESSFDVIFVLNAEGVLQFVSPSWEKHFGYPAGNVIGHNFKPLVHPDDAPLCTEYFIKVLTSGVSGTSPPYRIRHVDGSWRTFTANGTSYVDNNGTLLYIGVGRDISDQKRAEDERVELERKLLHAQKLESLGVLAGGIAHDFNNLLTAILGNLDLALMRLPQSSPVRTNIEQSMLASRRASDLTRQMLAYSGKGLFELKEIDLNEIVRDNIDLFKAVVPRNVSFAADAESALPPIMADPGQIQQVVMNLITNAVEALGASKGVVVLTTGVMTCDDRCIRKSLLEEKPPPGKYVFIEVSDNGCGMDVETQRRLFEPFFTTKFTGRGLGMAATQGIVRTHLGIILLESSVGEGTTFRILLPAIESSITQPVVAIDSPLPGAGHSVEHKGKILVVDDEESVRALAAEYVRHFGFEAIEAGDGIEALELYRRHADGIDLVILDLAMPNMDGVSAFFELKKIRPDVRVILSSGYSEQAVAEQFKQEKPVCFIQKPFQLKELEAKITIAMS
ncbi:MAG: PAS domain S-box protein [Oryzomonas sp.]|uniref:hybrid sensor histidine kinase/response regulator n=1 Tax=Oryzomonas sp. TaxID=2855186 RepID=UPI00283CF57E|nr:PAS domain S-box protein [Oryzomonas sp.]MDR3580261.1 PAS domain S-box protein [Oryzomonas sp.]